MKSTILPAAWLVRSKVVAHLILATKVTVVRLVRLVPARLVL
jgi:hypothetical protein